MTGPTMRERMLAGELYIADDPDLARDAERAMALTHRLNAMDPNDAPARRVILTELLGAFGTDSHIRPPLRCDYGYHISIGARTFVTSASSASTWRRSPSVTTCRSAPTCNC
jgi:maltose O-acetyltransferase